MTLHAYLHSDDAPKWAYWLTDFRGTLAYAVSDLGAAISRLGNRIQRDAPGDFWHGYRDGQQIAGVFAATTTRMRRAEAIELLNVLGVDTGPETLAKLGWGEDRVDNGGIEEDNESL